MPCSCIALLRAVRTDEPKIAIVKLEKSLSALLLDEHWLEWLDYYVFFASKGRNFNGTPRLFQFIQKNASKMAADAYFCSLVFLLSLELEQLVVTGSESRGAEEGGWQESAAQSFSIGEKAAKKIAKCLPYLTQSLLTISRSRALVDRCRRAKIQRLILHLLGKFPEFPQFARLQMFYCIYLATEDELDRYSFAPIELCTFALLRFPTATRETIERHLAKWGDCDCKQDASCQQLLLYLHSGCSGLPPIVKFVCNRQISFVCCKAIMAVQLMRGNFDQVAKFYSLARTVRPSWYVKGEFCDGSAATLELIVFFSLLERGLEGTLEEFFGQLRNSESALLLSLGLKFFGRRIEPNLPQAAADSAVEKILLRAIASFSAEAQMDLSDAIENCFTAIGMAANLLKSSGLPSVQPIVSFLNLWLVHRISLLYLTQGAFPLAKRFIKVGTEASVGFPYWEELFRAREQLFEFRLARHLDPLGHSQYLRSYLDQCICCNAFEARFLDEKVSSWFHQQVSLLQRSVTHFDRLYGDCELEAKYFLDPSDLFSLWIDAFYAGSVWNVSRLCARLFDSFPAVVELSRGLGNLRMSKQPLVSKEVLAEAARSFPNTVFRNLLPDCYTVVSIYFPSEGQVCISQICGKEFYFFKFSTSLSLSDGKAEWKRVMSENLASISIPSDIADELERKAVWWKRRSVVDKKILATLSRLFSTWFGLFWGLFFVNGNQALDEQFLEKLSQALQIPISFRLRLFSNILVWSIEKLETVSVTDISKCAEAFGFSTQSTLLISKELEFSRVLRSPLPDLPLTQKFIYIPDKKIFDIPLENSPPLSNFTVTRVDSIWTLKMLVDRESCRPLGDPIINGVLNPGGDLRTTEELFSASFRSRFRDFHIGLPKPTEEQYLELLKNCDMFVYFGHGSGDSIARNSAIRGCALKCAHCLLIGCSSGRPKGLDGDFDPTGTVDALLAAGAQRVCAALWDVTDGDTDRMMQESLEKIFSSRSVLDSIATSRSKCLLSGCTAAAFVLFGLPE